MRTLKNRIKAKDLKNRELFYRTYTMNRGSYLFPTIELLYRMPGFSSTNTLFEIVWQQNKNQDIFHCYAPKVDRMDLDSDHRIKYVIKLLTKLFGNGGVTYEYKFRDCIKRLKKLNIPRFTYSAAPHYQFLPIRYKNIADDYFIAKSLIA